MNKLVSVIVTVHNSARYLRRCLDSVTHQSLKDIEILCIDDSSTDASPDILREYAKKDARIRIINDPDSSYGHKINRGIDLAEGRYLSIIETDDLYQRDMLKNLLEAAESTGVDYADGNYSRLLSVGDKRVRINTPKYPSDAYGRVLKNAENIQYLGRPYVMGIWTGLYRGSFLRKNHIRLSETPGASYQDTSFAFLILALAESAYHLNQSVYEYSIDNDGSSTYDHTKIMAIAKEYDCLYSELKSRNVSKDIWDKYYIMKYIGYYWNAQRLGLPAAEEFLDFYHDELVSDDAASHISRESMSDLLPQTYELLDDRWAFEQKLISSNKEELKELKSDIQTFIDRTKGRHVIIFGHGIKGRKMYHFLQDNQLDVDAVAFCDNNSAGGIFDNLNVILPETAVREYPDSLFIVPKGKYSDEMIEQLRSLNLSDDRILVEDFV